MNYKAIILAIFLPCYAATASEQQNVKASTAPWQMPTMQGVLTSPSTWWAVGGAAVGYWGLKLIKDYYLRAVKIRDRVIAMLHPYAYCNINGNRVDLITKNPEIDRVLPQEFRVANAKNEAELGYRSALLRGFLPFAIKNNDKNDIGKDKQKSEELKKLYAEATHHNIWRAILPTLLANAAYYLNERKNDRRFADTQAELHKPYIDDGVYDLLNQDSQDSAFVRDGLCALFGISNVASLARKEVHMQIVEAIYKEKTLWHHAQVIARQEGFKKDSIPCAVQLFMEERERISYKEPEKFVFTAIEDVHNTHLKWECVTDGIDTVNPLDFLYSTIFLNDEREGEIHINFRTSQLHAGYNIQLQIIREKNLLNCVQILDTREGYKPRGASCGEKRLQADELAVLNRHIIKHIYNNRHQHLEAEAQKIKEPTYVTRDEGIQLVGRPTCSWFMDPFYWLKFGEKAIKKQKITYEPTLEDYADVTDAGSGNGKMIRFTNAQRELGNKICSALNCDDSKWKAIFSDSTPKDPQLRAAFDNYCFALLSFQHKETVKCEKILNKLDDSKQKAFDVFIASKHKKELDSWFNQWAAVVPVAVDDNVIKFSKKDLLLKCKKLYNAHDNLIEAAIEFHDELKKQGHDLYGKDVEKNCGSTLKDFGVHADILAHHGFDKDNNWALIERKKE